MVSGPRERPADASAAGDVISGGLWPPEGIAYLGISEAAPGIVGQRVRNPP